MFEAFKRRYKPQWYVEHETSGCFTVRSAAGDRLCHVYYRELPPEYRVGQFYVLDKAEAQCLAESIAALGDEAGR